MVTVSYLLTEKEIQTLYGLMVNNNAGNRSILDDITNEWFDFDEKTLDSLVTKGYLYLENETVIAERIIKLIFQFLDSKKEIVSDSTFKYRHEGYIMLAQRHDYTLNLWKFTFFENDFRYEQFKEEEV